MLSKSEQFGQKSKMAEVYYFLFLFYFYISKLMEVYCCCLPSQMFVLLQS